MTTATVITPRGAAIVSDDGVWNSDDWMLAKFLEVACSRSSWKPHFGNPIAWMGRAAQSLLGGELVVRGEVRGSDGMAAEAFCPTGEGGGVDNSCSSADKDTATHHPAPAKRHHSLSGAMQLARLSTTKEEPVSTEPKIRVTVRDADGVKAWQERLGVPEKSHEQFALAAGALEGSTVALMGGRGGIHMEVHDDRYRAVTSVQKSAEGDLYLENWHFNVFPHERGQGLGTEIMKAQVDGALAIGARGMVVHTIGDWERRDTHNGYYTWPRMGFDGDLPADWQSRMMQTGLQEIPDRYRKAKRVSDFFKHPEGRELWKRHGFPMELAFDVTPGSLSRRVFDHYYASQNRTRVAVQQEEEETEQARAARWAEMDRLMDEMDRKEQNRAGESDVSSRENHNSFDVGVDQDEAAYGEAWDAITRKTAEALSSLNLTPPESVRSNARRGLELREKNGGKGGTVVGVARARDLANGANLSPRTIGRMVSFFARHQGNEEGGVDDEGHIAWLLWGGDAGKRWANARWEEIQRARG